MFKLSIISIFLLLQITTLSANKKYNEPAFILGAGNLKFVFPEILKSFYHKYPDAKVYIEYSSSGYHTKNIFEGKEYDIFFSADIKYPLKVYEAKKSATKPKKYAQGILILFIPSNPLLAKEKIELLKTKDIKAITIPNKEKAPYGKAAIQTLNNTKCYDYIKDKIVYSRDVATAINNVIWNKHAGFLSKSALNMVPNNLRREGIDWIEVDEKYYKPILQAYTISKDGLKNDNAMKFLNFIESKKGQKIFTENGYNEISIP
ncbi:MAG: molybdate ABC transporter substrate-binding protein [Campylobacterota bacterium]|nr:molybdate ABC transporter substrate-binding protein [Campylobacterota bacterium]